MNIKNMIATVFFIVILVSCTQKEPIPTTNQSNTKSDQGLEFDRQFIIGKWSGEAGWISNKPAWLAVFEFSTEKVTASFTRSGDEIFTADGSWTLSDNNITIQFVHEGETTTYVGIIAGDNINGTMSSSDGASDGIWSLTRNE
jgi:hypothetical protein